MPAPALSPTEVTLAHQAGLSVLAFYLLDALKRASWFPWLSTHTETLNRLVSLAIAIATATGLQILSSTGNFHTGGVITISYPPLTTILDTVIHAAGQFGLQESLHKLKGNHVLVKELDGRVGTMEKVLDQVLNSPPSISPGSQMGAARVASDISDLRQTLEIISKQVSQLVNGISGQ